MGPGATAEIPEAMAGDSTLTLVPTFVVVAVDATGMGIILPLLPFYSQRLGATPFLISGASFGHRLFVAWALAMAAIAAIGAALAGQLLDTPRAR